METHEEEVAALGCCCGPKMDMEMKNAVAIQRNAAAISAVIKSLQSVQDITDAVKDNLAEITKTVASMRRDVSAVMRTVYAGPRCEVMTDDGVFSVPIAQDAPEYDDDSTSLP